MEKLKEILNYDIPLGKEGHISIMWVLILIAAIIATNVLLILVRRLITRKMPTADRLKFITVYSYFKYFIFLVVLLVALSAAGVNVSAIIAGAAALLIGIGLALQTLFQDIISGIFILTDQTLHVGDIIETEGKVGRVVSIRLRTTRAITIDNKVLIIPNHLFLTNALYNWTQNERTTRETVDVGVAYGSDVKLVEKLLLQATENVSGILKNPAPTVFFMNFGDSSLDFRLVFTVADSFMAIQPKSDLRFEIDRLFRENDITIPFPQRDVHIIGK